MLAAERVGLIGDYDVDGATATALLARYLRGLGRRGRDRDPRPHARRLRAERRGLDELAERGCRLVVTLDTGTTAFEPWPMRPRSGSR